MTPTISQPDTDEVKAMAERIERARKFIATEYADPSQLPKGDWISPAAKPAHDALCLVLEQLDRLSAQAQAQGSGTVKVTTIRQLADDPNSASGKSLRDVPVTHPSAGPAVRSVDRSFGLEVLDDMEHEAKYQQATIDPRREQQLRIQALGAALSRRDWQATEIAYNAIRDAFDNQPRLTTLDPRGPSEKKDDVQTRSQNEESRVADTSCTKSASLSDPGEKFWAGLKANAETRRTESAGFPPRAVFADPILHSDTKKG